jgi:hypothetical protein
VARGDLADLACFFGGFKPAEALRAIDYIWISFIA